MKIVIADDEKLQLEKLEEAVREAIPDAEITAFSRPSHLLVHVEENPCDIAFLDIHMPGMTGLTLAKLLKDVRPGINIIFVTAYDEHKGDAMDLHATGYIMKPVNADKIREELKELRYIRAPRQEKILQIRCFGTFDVFDREGVPLHFERSKAKELFAYIVSRSGARCTTPELINVLFEGEAYDMKTRNYFQHLVTSMMKALRAVGAENVINREYRQYSLNTSLVDCDYYRFRQMDVSAINSYSGEFMVQYSWAESIAGDLWGEM